ncbi:MAG TPA: two-component regulator propeller domain-containing protein, partial [Chitinophagaceae bacterium]
MIFTRQKIGFSVLLLATFIGSVASAQKFSFLQYGVEEGLAQSQVYAIRQDSVHQLWMATLGGLSRFDGRNFTNYSAEDGLMSNFTTSLLIDRNQRIWVGSQLGISYFDGSRFKNYHLNRKTVTSYVYGMVEAKDGIFAVYQGKLFKANYSECHELKLPPLIEDSLTTIGKDDRGYLLIATVRGDVYKYSSNTWQRIYKTADHDEPNLISGIETGHSGVTWLLGYRQILRLSHDTISGISSKIPPGILRQLISVYDDSQDNLWLGSSKGVYEIKKDGAIIYFNSANGFTDNSIFSVTEDVDGNVWFASNGSGILRFSNNNLNYWGVSNGLPDPVVLGITEDRVKNIWFGTFGGGI